MSDAPSSRRERNASQTGSSANAGVLLVLTRRRYHRSSRPVGLALRDVNGLRFARLPVMKHSLAMAVSTMVLFVAAYAAAQPAGSAQPQGMSCEQMMMGQMRGMMSGSGMSSAPKMAKAAASTGVCPLVEKRRSIR